MKDIKNPKMVKGMFVAIRKCYVDKAVRKPIDEGGKSFYYEGPENPHLKAVKG